MKEPKITIRPFRIRPALPCDYEQKSWAILEAALGEIHSSLPLSFSLEQLYRICESLCVQKKSEFLFNKLIEICKEDVKKKKLEFLSVMHDLEKISTFWEKYCSQLSTIKSIFLYLDRTFLLSSSRSIWNIGMELFRDEVLTKDSLNICTKAIIDLITRERDNEENHSILIKTCVQMYRTLNIYYSEFEQKFIESTRNYYSLVATNFFSKDIPSIRDYLDMITCLVHEESNRGNFYLDQITLSLLEAAIYDVLVRERSSMILKFSDSIFSQCDQQHLHLLFRFFSKIECVEELRLYFSKFVKTNGSSIMYGESDNNLIAALIEFKHKLDDILNSFESLASADCMEKFNYTFKESFESVIHQRKSILAPLLSQFVTDILCSSKQRESLPLDDILTILRLSHDQNVFENIYKRHLAKRLLSGKPYNEDIEKSVIFALKQQFGSDFTSSLEGMFNDLELSLDLNSDFRKSKWNKSSIDINILVLTQEYWLLQKPILVKLPPLMSSAKTAIEEFYSAKYPIKRLTFNFSEGSCILRAHFPLGKKDLIVSPFQTIVLLLFNDLEECGFSFIQETTGIPESELKSILASLIYSKVRVLLLANKRASKDILDTDSFKFNDNFQSSHSRLRVPGIAYSDLENKSKQETQMNEIHVDRSAQIDSNIVRIMKSKRTASFQELFLSVSEMCKERFQLIKTDFQKRVEELISKDFLEKINHDVYRYVP